MSSACATDERWLRHELGDLSVNDSDALDAHLPGCPACRARAGAVARMLADLKAAARALPDDGGAFRRRVRAALAEAAAAPPAPAGADAGRPAAAPARRPGPLPGHRWPLLALVASVALVPALLAVQQRPGGGARPLPGSFGARGDGAARAAATGAEVLLVRDGRPLPVGGQTLRPADALAVRVGNRGARPLYLMAFGVDAAGEVHWLYPPYRDPASDPRALRIEAGAPPRLLDELVAPDGAAAGPLQLYTLLLPAPLTVRAVERRLAAHAGRPVPALFPDAATRAWTAHWPEQAP
jgi:hypothetical protein